MSIMTHLSAARIQPVEPSRTHALAPEALFSSFQINGLALPNRVVMAPMTRSFSPGGVPTEAVAAYYRRRAEGGVGLIITEGTGIDRPASLNDDSAPRFHGEALGAWKKVVDEVHAAGGRIRFGAEVVKAVRAAVGGNFPVILRISQWKGQDYSAKLATSPQELEAWVAPLVDAGADVIHCSQRRFWEPEFEGSDLNLAGWVKKITGKPTITVGFVGLDLDVMTSFQGEPARTQSLDVLLKRLERREFDLVAVGRALLNDPTWLQKIADGRIHELRAFDPKSFETLH